MSSQSFRHRENEEQEARNRPELQASAEARNRQIGGTDAQESPRPALASPKTPLFPEAIDLGSAASLFRIAGSQIHPDPQAALDSLRLKMKKTLEREEEVRVPAKTALRDRLTSTDSLWIPALKAIAALVVCALLAAAVYYVVEFLQPVSPQPAAAAGAAIVSLLSL